MRSAVVALEESLICEVAQLGMGRGEVLALWFGEGDEETQMPMPVRQAALDSILRGETFYTPNPGLPELRQALAGHMGRLHGAVAVERIAVTSGGVHALMLAVQAPVDPGDELLALTPLWPHLCAQALIMGARLRCVSLWPQADGVWARC